MLENYAWKLDGQARGDPKQLGFHYLPEYFETLRCPVMRKDFPRCVVIPEHHVRYVFATHLFWTAIPRFFLNNEMAAKAVFVRLGCMPRFATAPSRARLASEVMRKMQSTSIYRQYKI